MVRWKQGEGGEGRGGRRRAADIEAGRRRREAHLPPCASMRPLLSPKPRDCSLCALAGSSACRYEIKRQLNAEKQASTVDLHMVRKGDKSSGLGCDTSCSCEAQCTGLRMHAHAVGEPLLLELQPAWGSALIYTMYTPATGFSTAVAEGLLLRTLRRWARTMC